MVVTTVKSKEPLDVLVRRANDRAMQIEALLQSLAVLADKVSKQKGFYKNDLERFVGLGQRAKALRGQQ